MRIECERAFQFYELPAQPDNYSERLSALVWPQRLARFLLGHL